MAESNAPASQAIRVDIAERIQSGQTDEQIRDVLRRPLRRGHPAHAVGVGHQRARVGAAGRGRWPWPSAFLVIVFRRWGQEASAHASEADKALVAEALLREHEQDVADDDPYGEGSSR